MGITKVFMRCFTIDFAFKSDDGHRQVDLQPGQELMPRNPQRFARDFKCASLNLARILSNKQIVETGEWSHFCEDLPKS